MVLFLKTIVQGKGNGAGGVGLMAFQWSLLNGSQGGPAMGTEICWPWGGSEQCAWLFEDRVSELPALCSIREGLWGWPWAGDEARSVHEVTEGLLREDPSLPAPRPDPSARSNRLRA